MEKFSKPKVVGINKNKTEAVADFLSQPHKTYSLSHHVCAIYPEFATADEARDHLIDQGFVETEITILQDEFPNHGHRAIGALDDEVLTLTCVDFGTNRTAIMISANVTLFIAKHLLKSLVWNDNLITVNAIVNAALKTGGVLLHVQTEYESDKELAKEILSDSLELQDEVAIASYQ
jgi:hypothetical protein